MVDHAAIDGFHAAYAYATLKDAEARCPHTDKAARSRFITGFMEQTRHLTELCEDQRKVRERFESNVEGVMDELSPTNFTGPQLDELRNAFEKLLTLATGKED